MRFVFPLLAGLVLGVAIRLLWPLTDRALDAAERPKAGRRGDRNVAARPAESNAPHASLSSSVATAAEAVFREADLVRAKTKTPEPSWLYVFPPRSALLRSETYVEASIAITEGEIDERCAALFVQLGLPPAREDQLRRALAEMVFARKEITTLAEVDPKRPTPARVQEMIDASDEQHRQRIQGLLGREAFARFENYFDSIGAREELRGAFLRCAAFAEPLTPQQRDLLVAARHATSQGQSPRTDSATFLSPAQQAAFAQWQIDQVAQQKMGELLGRAPRRFDAPPIYTRTKTPEGARP